MGALTGSCCYRWPPAPVQRPLPFTSTPESGVAVAFWGRLDNRPDLISQLEAQHNASDDELIALAWLKWGEYCPEKLIGDFAFAVASPKTGMVFLARDVMGVKPLFYRADAHGVFFANSAAAFKPLKLGTLTPSQEWMARFMLGVSFQDVGTAYEELKKIPGSHCLLITCRWQDESSPLSPVQFRCAG